MKQLLLLLTLIAMGCTPNKTAKDWNQFMRNVPEYQLKADILELQPEQNMNKDSTDIEFFNSKASIPGKWSVEKNSPIIYVIKNKEDPKKEIFITNEIVYPHLTDCKDQIYPFGYEEGFCSAFNSEIEFYEKLYTLTPDIKELSMGDRWIICRKKTMFRDVNKISIFKNKNFITFKKDGEIDTHIKTVFNVFPYNPDEDYTYLKIAMSFSDDALIESLLKSLNKL